MAARIALFITLVLLLAAAYFAYDTHNHVSGLRQNVADLTNEWNSTKQELAKTQTTLKTTQDNLAKETADDEATKAQLQTVQSNLDAANAQVTSLNAKIDDLNKQIASLKGAQGQNAPQVATFTKAEMDAVKAQLADATNQVAELTQIKETLTNKVKDAENRADDLQKVVDHYKNGTVRNGLEGEVLAVNQGWNFVVLSIGDRQGAVANAEMILKRGDSQIGKVRITEVEPSTSVADIIPGSLARGVRVQPGDRVVFHGS